MSKTFWLIEGQIAPFRPYRDVALWRIEADTAAEADLVARERGMFVTSIRRGYGEKETSPSGAPQWLSSAVITGISPFPRNES